MYNRTGHAQTASNRKDLPMNIVKRLLGVLFAIGAVAGTSARAQELFAASAIATARSGYWVGAYSFGPAANGDIALLKYSNDDSLVFAKPFGTAQGFRDQFVYGVEPLRDGGAIVIGVSNAGTQQQLPSYTLYRVDSTGTLLWSIPQSYSTAGTPFFGADNSGGAWFPYNGHIYRADGNGAVTDFGQVTLGLSDNFAATVDPASGALYFITPQDANLLSPGSLVRYTPAGTKTTLWTAPDAATRLQYITLGSDGNIYAIGNNASTHIAMSFGPSGNVRWTTTFGSALYSFSAHSDIATQVCVFADGTLVALDTSAALYRIGTTGQAQQIPIGTYALGQSDSAVLTSSQGDIVLFTRGGNILRLDDTGETLFNLPAGTSTNATLLVDGTLIFETITPAYPVYAHLDRNGKALATSPNLTVSLAAPAQMRVDQIGLDGAWYEPAESGQGFTIDYIAESNYLFIPWFTYGVDPVSDTSGMAWVTFQGSVAAGAKSAALQIARSEPGTFNSGSVPPKVIGTATLTATDCTKAYLRYQFDADEFGGLGGYIPLTRLSPSTTPCIQANGQTTPAQIANVPLHGFDANQSGSWYDPSTSGQGIELTIMPPGGSFASGLVFGAWFTFDVPPANDPLHEQWFTVQGDLSGALNGTVTLPIYTSYGGSLDSLPATGTGPVGTATLTMLSCTSATLAYEFPQFSPPIAFSGSSGTINLVKIGGCVAP
jgi:hypothetical protein